VEYVPGWWQRLGGPNAISIVAWLFTLVGGTAAAFSWIPDGPDVRALEWIGLSLVAQLLLGCILLVAWLTYLSPRGRPSRTAALIATLLVAGWVRGAFLAYAGEQLHLVDDGFVQQRAVGAAVAFTVWYSLAALIVDEWRQHRAAVNQLRAELLHEQELAERSTSLITDFRASVLQQTQALLSAGLESAGAASSEPAAAAASLRRTVDDLIRPLSYELEQRAVSDAELLADVKKRPVAMRVPLHTYVAGIFTARPFAPLATAAVVVATPMVVTMHVLGPLVGGLAVVLSAVVVGLSLWLVRGPIMGAIPGWPTAVSAAVVIVTWVSVTLFVGLLLAAMGLDPSSSTMSVLLGMAIGTMVAAAVEGSVEQQQRAAQEELRDAVLAVEWSAARLRQRAWNEQRSLGRLLHGTVQATMVAAALKVHDQSPDEAAVTIAGLTSRLHYALGDETVTPWRRDIANLQEVWEGAIQLMIVVNPSAERTLDLDPLAAHSLLQVLNEGVTNAVRHGNADSVRATVEVESGYLLLTVMDDGTPAEAPGAAGTGSNIFDANCADWNLGFDSTTMLKARVACRGAERSMRGGVHS
jgi:signal transduction histidine kinase